MSRAKSRKRLLEQMKAGISVREAQLEASNVGVNWPTPDEIAERAAAIRREWSPRQLLVRAGRNPDEDVASIPEISMGGERRYFDVSRLST